MEYGEKWHIPSLLLSKYESYLIIKDVSSFSERLHKALDGLNLYWEHRLVEYKDFSNIMSEKTIFQKDVSYEYQKEFRLFIQNNKDESIQLILGDISDISIMGLTKDWGQKYFAKSSYPDSI